MLFLPFFENGKFPDVLSFVAVHKMCFFFLLSLLVQQHQAKVFSWKSFAPAKSEKSFLHVKFIIVRNLILRYFERFGTGWKA